MRYDHGGRTLLTCTTSPPSPRSCAWPPAPPTPPESAGPLNPLLVDLLDHHDSRADDHGRHTIELPPYGYRWLRAGGIDLTVPKNS